MPPRPFPHPFSVGIDICSIKRVNTLLQRHAPAHSSLPSFRPFLARIFSFREILLFNQRFEGLLHEPAASRDPALVTSAVRYLAGRFAAKEAVIKAVSSRRIFLKDVLVATQGSQPYAIVLDESPILTHVQRLYLNRNCGFSLPLSTEIDPDLDLESHPDLDPALDGCKGQVAKLSISHDGDYASAVCLAVEQTESSQLLSVLQKYRPVLAEIRAITAEMQLSTTRLNSNHDRWRRIVWTREFKRRRFLEVFANRIRQRVATIRMYSDALGAVLHIISKDTDGVSKSEPGFNKDRPAYIPDPSALYESIMGSGRRNRALRRKRN